MSMTEDALTKALEACWKSGQSPSMVRVGSWPFWWLKAAASGMRWSLIDRLTKAVKSAEEQLAKDWKRE
jgi:hypothetical protein